MIRYPTFAKIDTTSYFNDFMSDKSTPGMVLDLNLIIDYFPDATDTNSALNMIMTKLNGYSICPIKNFVFKPGTFLECKVHLSHDTVGEYMSIQTIGFGQELFNITQLVGGTVEDGHINKLITIEYPITLALASSYQRFEVQTDEQIEQRAIMMYGAENEDDASYILGECVTDGDFIRLEIDEKYINVFRNGQFQIKQEIPSTYYTYNLLYKMTGFIALGWDTKITDVTYGHLDTLSDTQLLF